MTVGPAPAAILVYSDDLAGHQLSPTHPFKPVRLRYTAELVRAAGLLEAPQSSLIAPRLATEAEITAFHSSEYVAMVRRLDAEGYADGMGQFGFGPGDNPPYPGIFDANALAAGSAMRAAELVAAGETSTAFAIAGGLHHAMPHRASGFCVFNDPVMAIMHLIREGMRVAYIDIDCHHGDGVQHGFYDTDQVLTISVHESGQFLFPGTGSTEEIGTGPGEGYSVNLPLGPYTGDETYLAAFDEVVPPLVQAFGPDVLFTQLGIDTHFQDPLTHLQLTTQGFRRVVERLAALAAETGRWIATGGGGYDLGAVARGWTMAYAVMAGANLPEEVPASFTSYPGPKTFSDDPPVEIDTKVAAQIEEYAARSVRQVRELIFPRFGLR